MPALEQTTEGVTKIQADAVVIGIYTMNGPLTGAAAEVDAAADGRLTKLLEAKELTGKRCEVTVLFALPGVAASQVLVVGLGERDRFDRQAAFRTAGAAARRLADKPRGKIAFYIGGDWSPELTEAGIAGMFVAVQGQDTYRTEKKRVAPEAFLWSGGQPEALRMGQIVAEAMNLTRRLVNEPPQKMYPESFADEAQQVAIDCRLDCEVWDQARLEKERAGSMLAVAQGSDREARLVILRHDGGGAGQAFLALVGKGVTFDSGGLSLKPTDSMKTMKCDMAGAAAVLGAMQAIARLKLPVNVIGLCGLVENMTGGSAMKLGDVLHARNGKTIEVLNTDAEGRLVLADVLDVALQLGASRIIDLATLTGACVVALGTDVVGVMTNDQPWCDTVLAAARTVGEPAWQLPMFAEYGDLIRSEVADIKNVGDGRWAGAITAAKFLEEFVDGAPWVHLDIAGPAFLDKPKAWQDAGGSGAMVRTLVEVVRGLAGKTE